MTSAPEEQQSPVESGSSADPFGFQVVHHPVPRTDGEAKVTGQAVYTADIHLPHMAFAKVLRSPVAHARLKSVDVSAALACPGVIAVVTGQDLLQLRSTNYGHAIRDHPVLATDKLRYIGEPVAAVVAEDETTAQHALDDIVIEYDELPAVVTPQEALAEGAPLVHERGYDQGGSPGHVEIDTKRKRTNVCHEASFRWGDIEAAFARAHQVVEGEFYFPMLYIYPLESFVSIADYRRDGITIHSSAPHLYMVRRDVADLFGLPLNRVRLITPFVGGAFGAKSYTKVEPIAAVCSWKARRPVRLQLTVEESVLTSRADDARIRVRTAVDAQGRVLARQGTVYMNTGAYAENSPLIVSKTAMRLIGAYSWEAVDVTGYAVYTNTCPASSIRGFGGIHSSLAGETQIDELAGLLGEDPIQFRLKNLPERGERFFPKRRPMTSDLKGSLHKVSEALHWGDPLPPNRGHGVALTAMDVGALPVGRSEVRIHGDGSVTVLTGSAELGQGSRTVLGQIAAEEFGTTLENVRVEQSDTALIPFARTTGADRTTALEGRTVLHACVEAKEQLRAMAADIWEAAPEDIVLERTGVSSEGRRMTWGEIIGKYFTVNDMEVTGRAEIRPEGELAELPPWWETPLVGVEVEVNPATGSWRLEKLCTVADAGLAINPTMVDGQELGAAMMGLGVAIAEDLIYDGPQLVNGTMLEYRVPRFSDTPAEVSSFIVENRDGIGPYGAKGIADGPITVIHAAVANAIYQAVGVRLRSAPFTPERIWRALREQGVAAASPGRSEEDGSDGSAEQRRLDG